MASTVTGTRAETPRTVKPVRFYRPELDALRFFAFLGVFFVHGPAYPLPANATLAQKQTLANLYVAREAGIFGLDIFFLLSSYLITELLLRERESTGTIHMRAFYTRRILRIWPLYYLIIAVGIVTSLILPGAQELTRFQLISLLFFVVWMGTDTYHNGAGVLWSISVEEWFYVLWPGITKLGGSRAVLYAALAIIPISLITSAFVTATWFNPVVQFLFFAVGALLALLLRERSLKGLPLVARLGMVAFALSGFWKAGAYIGAYSGPMYPGTTILIYLLDAAACSAMFLSFFDLPARFIPQWLIYLGKISYGLYVFHPFALVGIAKVIRPPAIGENPVGRLVLINAAALGSTILVAACSYRWFEKPILKLKERFAYIPSRAA